MPIWAVVLISPFALISMVFALILIFGRKKLPSIVPPPFLLMMLGITAVISIILLTARSQAPRYFFPLAFLWEAFLPLFILQLVPHISFSFVSTPQQQEQARRLASIALVTIILAGQAVLLVHLYFLPQVIFICPHVTNRWLFCDSTSAYVW